MRSESAEEPFDLYTAEFLETGCALVVGTVSSDGQPRAMRGWGATVLGGGPRLRLVVDASETVSMDHCASGGRVAITATDVRTLRSIQLKGRALGVEPATVADLARAERFCDDFFADVEATDGTARSLLMHLVPIGYAVIIVTIDELFDQTPGPGAGGPLESSTR